MSNTPTPTPTATPTSEPIVYVGMMGAGWQSMVLSHTSLPSEGTESAYINTFKMPSINCFTENPEIEVGYDWVADENSQYRFTSYEVTSETTLLNGTKVSSYKDLEPYIIDSLPTRETLTKSVESYVGEYLEMITLGEIEDIDSFTVSMWVSFEEITNNEPNPTPTVTPSNTDAEEPELVLSISNLFDITYDRLTKILTWSGDTSEKIVIPGESTRTLLTVSVVLDPPQTPTPTSTPTTLTTPTTPTVTSIPSRLFSFPPAVPRGGTVSVYINKELADEQYIDEVYLDNEQEFLQSSIDFNGTTEELHLFSEKLSMEDIGKFHDTTHDLEGLLAKNQWRTEYINGQHTTYKFITPCEIDLSNANPVVSFDVGDIAFDNGDAIGFRLKRVHPYYEHSNAISLNEIKEYLDDEPYMLEQYNPKTSPSPSPSESPATGISGLSSMTGLITAASVYGSSPTSTTMGDIEDEMFKKDALDAFLNLSQVYRSDNGFASSGAWDIGWYILDTAFAILDMADFGILGMLRRGGGLAIKAGTTKGIRRSTRIMAAAAIMTYRTRIGMSVSGFWRAVSRIVNNCFTRGLVRTEHAHFFAPSPGMSPDGIYITSWTFPNQWSPASRAARTQVGHQPGAAAGTGQVVSNLSVVEPTPGLWFRLDGLTEAQQDVIDQIQHINQGGLSAHGPGFAAGAFDSSLDSVLAQLCQNSPRTGRQGTPVDPFALEDTIEEILEFGRRQGLTSIQPGVGVVDELATALNRLRQHLDDQVGDSANYKIFDVNGQVFAMRYKGTTHTPNLDHMWHKNIGGSGQEVTSRVMRVLEIEDTADNRVMIENLVRDLAEKMGRKRPGTVNWGDLMTYYLRFLHDTPQRTAQQATDMMSLLIHARSHNILRITENGLDHSHNQTALQAFIPGSSDKVLANLKEIKDKNRWIRMRRVSAKSWASRQTPLVPSPARPGYYSSASSANTQEILTMLGAPSRGTLYEVRNGEGLARQLEQARDYYNAIHDRVRIGESNLRAGRKYRHITNEEMTILGTGFTPIDLQYAPALEHMTAEQLGHIGDNLHQVVDELEGLIHHGVRDGVADDIDDWAHLVDDLDVGSTPNENQRLDFPENPAAADGEGDLTNRVGAAASVADEFGIERGIVVSGEGAGNSNNFTTFAAHHGKKGKIVHTTKKPLLGPNPHGHTVDTLQGGEVANVVTHHGSYVLDGMYHNPQRLRENTLLDLDDPVVQYAAQVVDNALHHHMGYGIAYMDPFANAKQYEINSISTNKANIPNIDRQRHPLAHARVGFPVEANLRSGQGGFEVLRKALYDQTEPTFGGPPAWNSGGGFYGRMPPNALPDTISSGLNVKNIAAGIHKGWSDAVLTRHTVEVGGGGAAQTCRPSSGTFSATTQGMADNHRWLDDNFDELAEMLSTSTGSPLSDTGPMIYRLEDGSIELKNIDQGFGPNVGFERVQSAHGTPGYNVWRVPHGQEAKAAFNYVVAMFQRSQYEKAIADGATEFVALRRAYDKLTPHLQEIDAVGAKALVECMSPYLWKNSTPEEIDALIKGGDGLVGPLGFPGIHIGRDTGQTYYPGHGPIQAAAGNVNVLDHSGNLHGDILVVPPPTSIARQSSPNPGPGDGWTDEQLEYIEKHYGNQLDESGQGRVRAPLDRTGSLLDEQVSDILETPLASEAVDQAGGPWGSYYMRNRGWQHLENLRSAIDPEDGLTYGLGRGKNQAGKVGGKEVAHHADTVVGRAISQIRHNPLSQAAICGLVGYLSGANIRMVRPGNQLTYAQNMKLYLEELTSDPMGSGELPVEQTVTWYNKTNFLGTSFASLIPGTKWKGLPFLDYGSAGYIEVRRTDDYTWSRDGRPTHYKGEKPKYGGGDQIPGDKGLCRFHYADEFVMVGATIDAPPLQDLIDTDPDYRCISEVQYNNAQKEKESKAAWMHDCHHKKWMEEYNIDWAEEKYPNAEWKKDDKTGLFSAWVYTDPGRGGALRIVVWRSPEGYLIKYNSYKDKKIHFPGSGYDWYK